MLKKCIRQTYLKKRELYTSQYIEHKTELIKNQLFSHFNFKDIHFLHTFLPIIEKNEINTFSIINELFTNHKNVNIIVPVIDFNSNNLFHKYYYKDATLHQNKYGIMEPKNSYFFTELNTLDVVLVPLLCFDKQGNRVGYGKGYYDRFLHKCNNAKKIGLSFEEPIHSIDDLTPFDCTLDYCITPNNVFCFN